MPSELLPTHTSEPSSETDRRINDLRADGVFATQSLLRVSGYPPFRVPLRIRIRVGPYPFPDSISRTLAPRRAAEAAAEIEEQVEAGFVWTGELYELLGEYERDREAYPSMAEFMDRVVGFFREFAGGG